jgi:LuxR family quorum sensing-dependent transcriptional regulator
MLSTPDFRGFYVRIDELIAEIQGCSTLDDLKLALQRIVESYGFAAFNFLDTGHPNVDVPMYFGTSGKAWESEYLRNNFVHVDPCVSRARRTNTPFSWGSVSLPAYSAGRKPGAIKTLEAARDHGFKDGFVVPYHFADSKGRIYSSLVVFFWRDSAQKFNFLISSKKYEIHLIMIYWMQRAIDLIATTVRRQPMIFRTRDVSEGPLLTDRERDVLSWAARGKTVAETADILKISKLTIEGYVASALRKLNASNKTHAVAKCVHLGLIDV